MHAVRCGSFNPRRVQVSGGTARKAVSHVASTIVQSGRPDPTKNLNGDTDIRLLRQTKAYREADQPVRHQKALPPDVFRHMLHSATDTRSTAIAQITTGALFYACRSCEYTLVPKKERKTRPLRVCDIEFRSGPRIIPHDDPDIFSAKTVVLKFGPQKTGVYDDEIPMDRTTDPSISPIVWARIVTRLRSYPRFSPHWPVYTFYDPATKRFRPIRNTDVERAIKTSVIALGRDTLGFGPDDVGTHSVRSSLAMQLYLQHVQPYTIMLIGRWRSLSFLSYIEKQCQEFTRGMSQIMLTLDSFYHLPPPPRPTNPTDGAIRPHRRKGDASYHSAPSHHRTHPHPRAGRPHHLTDDASHHHHQSAPVHHSTRFIHFGRLHALRSRSSA